MLSEDYVSERFEAGKKELVHVRTGKQKNEARRKEKN